MTERFFKLERNLYSCKKFKKQHLYLIHETRFFNSTGKPLYKSQGLMAQESGTSITSISRAITELSDMGILNVQNHKFKQTLRITMNTEKLNQYIHSNAIQHDEDGGFSPDALTNEEMESFSIRQNENHLHQNDGQGKHIREQNNKLLQFSEKIATTPEKKYFIDQLEVENFPGCHEAMRALSDLKSEYDNVYTGSQVLEVWEKCETKLEYIHDAIIDSDSYDGIYQFIYGIFIERKLYTRKASIGLPFIIDPNDKAHDYITAYLAFG